jgi:dienelactone hydrolase
VYERLHAQLGLATSSVIPSTLAGLGGRDAYGRALGPLATELLEEGGARPVLVHAFSDNGCLGYAALLAALAASPRGPAVLASIRGVIFDSAPGLWAVRGRLDFARRFARAMAPAVSRLAGRGRGAKLPGLLPLLTAGFVGYQLLFPGQTRAMLEAQERIVTLQPPCPQLFLVGDGDTVVPPRDIRAWIERQRAAGLDVEEQAFPGARHVALFPSDPKRYRATLAAFVARALGAPAVAH